MINKNEICIIVGSYPQDHLDTTLVSLTIESFKRQGYDICLTSHTPVSNDLQKASKYFIYSDENYTLNFPEPSSIATYFANNEIHYTTNWGNRMGAHSLAILMNMKNALYLLKNKKYKSFIYVECDTFLNSNDHKILESKLNEIDFHNKDYWFMLESSTNMIIPVTTIFGGNIDYFSNKFTQIETEEDYLNSFASVFKHCIDVAFTAVPEKDYDFWVVAFHDKNDETMFRQDADINEINRVMQDPDGYCKIWREFNTITKPSYWVVWPHSTSKGWCDRLTGKL